MKKKSKIIISFLLTLVMLVTTVKIQAEETGDAILKLENQQIIAMVGSSFEVPLFIENNSGIMGLDIIVEYDKTCVEPVEVTAGTVFQGETLNDSIDTSTTNSFHIMWAGSDNITADGELFKVKFNLKKKSEIGNTNISFQVNSEDTYDELYDSVMIGAATLNVETTTDVIVKKLPELAVYMEDWTVGEEASTPVLVGNIENGTVIYEYSVSPDGFYSEDVPTQVGQYFLKVTVAETNNYQSGVTTCTFRILEKSLPAPTIESTPVPSPISTKGTDIPGVKPSAAPIVTASPAPGDLTDHSEKSKIMINLKKKKYNARYKVVVKSAVEINRIKINNKVIKNVKGRKSYTFRLSKYKKYLRKKWNVIRVWDVNGKSVTRRFKVKVR